MAWYTMDKNRLSLNYRGVPAQITLFESVRRGRNGYIAILSFPESEGSKSMTAPFTINRHAALVNACDIAIHMIELVKEIDNNDDVMST